MIYSRPTEYALRALTYMGVRNPRGVTRVQEIAQAEDLPAPFLAKVLQQLARSGLLISVKGPKGGFGFSRPPAQISLMAVVAVVDGTEGISRCAVGLVECSDDAPCPLHEAWKPLRNQINGYLEGISVADLATALNRKRQILNRKLPISRAASER